MLNLSPRKMQEAMKQMGISQENIDASKVIIETKDDKKIIINNPVVAKIKVQGQESFQISGEVNEEISISEQDIKTVMEKTGHNKEESKRALEKTQDLAGAILELSHEN